jgi:tetratricopeptide (TPR) repeat protein
MVLAASPLALVVLLAAAPTRHEAERLFKAGTAAYEEGRYEEALADYAAAYEALPLAQLLLDIAQCDRQLGRWKEAELHYRQYLSAKPDAPNRGEVEGYLAEVRAAEAKAAAAPTPPAVTTVEARRVDLSPPPQPAPVAGVETPARRASSGPYWLGGAGIVVALAGGSCLIAGEVMQGGDTRTPDKQTLGDTDHTLTAPNVATINGLLVASYVLFGVGGAALLGATGWAGASWSSRP